MTTLTRWNPWREMMTLYNQMDQLFDNFADISPTNWQETGTWSLAVDMTENDESFVVKASVPGLSPDDLDISIANNVLTIIGEYSNEADTNKDKFHIQERRYGRFSRSLAFPTSIVADTVEAEYTNGVLTLTIPKSEKARPRRIQIKPNGSHMLESNVVGD